MKKFLTSGLIFGLIISPAIADDTLYKDTNIGESCTTDFLGSSSGNAANSFLAQYTPNDYPVSAGAYLPARAIEGVQCPVNSYCAGGTFTFSETTDSGINACPDGFTLSAAGTSNENDCYHNCTASDIVNGEKVATIKGGTVTKGGTNTCDATCTTGYTFVTNPLSNKESIAGTGNWGCANFTARGSKMSEFGLISGSGEFATEFNYGIIRGIASCNEIPGDNGNMTWNNDRPNLIKPENTFNQSSTGRYCWCKITGYIPLSGSLQRLYSSWMFGYDSGNSNGTCPDMCATGCANYIGNSDNFRSVLFESVSGGAICVANEITVTWDQANGQGSVTNTCTYDGDITLPTAPIKTGYTFSGWKLVEPNNQ